MNSQKSEVTKVGIGAESIGGGGLEPGPLEPWLFSVKRACELLGIGKTRLYREIAIGRLRAVKFGSRTFFLASDLKDFTHCLPEIRPKTVH
jgi:excisionase family DNA binding protein